MNTQASTAEPEVITIRLGAHKNKAQLDAFMADFNAETVRIGPFSQWEDGLISFELKPFDGKIHLGAIISLERGAGRASRALDWLLRLADKHGVQVDGDIQRLGKDGLTHHQLRSWYKRHGFKVNANGRILYTPRPLEASADAPAAKSKAKPSGPSL